jgi:hypothetical protein
LMLVEKQDWKIASIIYTSKLLLDIKIDRNFNHMQYIKVSVIIIFINSLANLRLFR